MKSVRSECGRDRRVNVMGLLFAVRLLLSMIRWSMIGVSYSNMECLWEVMNDGSQSRRWQSRDLAMATGMPVGSFEAELVELDIAGLVDKEKPHAGVGTYRLNAKGRRVQKSELRGYPWSRPRWYRIKRQKAGA